MSDWKEKAEALSRKKDEGKKLLEEKEAEQKQARLRLEYENEYNRKLKILQRKFRCCVCGKLPTGPIPAQNYGTDWRDSYSTPANWNLPNNLYECKLGKHWACEDHIHAEVCQKCAESK